jgi:hypothetical protein
VHFLYEHIIERIADCATRTSVLHAGGPPVGGTRAGATDIIILVIALANQTPRFVYYVARTGFLGRYDDAGSRGCPA